MEKHYMKLLILAIAGLALTGCSYTRPIGQIGNTRYHSLKSHSIFGPSQTMIVKEDLKTGQTQEFQPMGGNGILNSVVQAGGFVGGAVALGNAFEGERTTTTINIADDPPAPPLPPKPPKTRPPPNRPPPHKGWH